MGSMTKLTPEDLLILASPDEISEDLVETMNDRTMKLQRVLTNTRKTLSSFASDPNLTPQGAKERTATTLQKVREFLVNNLSDLAGVDLQRLADNLEKNMLTPSIRLKVTDKDESTVRAMEAETRSLLRDLDPIDDLQGRFGLNQGDRTRFNPVAQHRMIITIGGTAQE